MSFAFTPVATSSYRPLDAGDHFGFTPVRRKDRTPYSDSPQVVSHAPWTATRCHRLLRPIASKLAALRRERNLAIPEPQAEPALHLDAKHQRKKSAVNSSKAAIPWASNGFDEDPDWDPEERPSKKLKRTYSARGVSGLSAQGRPASKEPAASQPSHATQARSSSEGSAHHSSQDDVQDSALPTAQIDSENLVHTRVALRRLAKAKTNCWMVYEGLFNGLDALLKATKKTQPSPEIGAPSLFTLCLRKVPAYIAQEQEVADEDDPECREDVAEAVYAELEDLSTSSQGGWKPLRDIVRAHGVHMIEVAIRDGTLPRALARKFIELCLKQRAVVEAKSLCTALLETTMRLPQPSEYALQAGEQRDGESVLDLLSGWFLEPKRIRTVGFMCRSLAELLQTGVLPIDYIGCERLRMLLRQARLAVDTQEDCAATAADAAELFRTAVFMSYWQTTTNANQVITEHRFASRSQPKKPRRKSSPDREEDGDACSQLSSNGDPRTAETTTREIVVFIAHAVASAAYTRDMGSDTHLNVPNVPWKSILSGLATNALQSQELEERSPHRAPTLDTVAVARRSMASLGLHLRTSILSGSPLSRLLLPPREDRAAIDLVAAFVREVGAQMKAKSFGFPFDGVPAMVERTLNLARTHPEAPAATDVALAAAFAFAEDTGRQAHLDWALEIEDEVHSGAYDPPPTKEDRSCDRPARHPRPRRSLGAYRWEAPIGEWVAKTPQIRKTVPGTTAVNRGPRVATAVCVPAPDPRRFSSASEPATQVATPPTTDTSGAEERSSAPKRRRGRPARAIVSPMPQPASPSSSQSAGAGSRADSSSEVDSSSDADPVDELAEYRGLLRRDEPAQQQERPVARPRGRPRKKPRGRERPPLVVKPQARRSPRIRRAPALTLKFDGLMDCSSEDELAF